MNERMTYIDKHHNNFTRFSLSPKIKVWPIRETGSGILVTQPGLCLQEKIDLLLFMTTEHGKKPYSIAK